MLCTWISASRDRDLDLWLRKSLDLDAELDRSLGLAPLLLCPSCCA